ncbi:unnamed protein product [Gongylonema pulchrum]|uniref:DUF3719 domain-containing protein n=1 Tax=Gongylonema pulchrum TaxID=637853 RepID=A0A183E0A3_9BILA|nr:unnamed protein product [Gongylonema pulchrum]
MDQNRESSEKQLSIKPLKKSSTANDCGRKIHFFERIEKSIYENEPVSDEEVEAECRLWARTLPHFR